MKADQVKLANVLKTYVLICLINRTIFLENTQSLIVEENFLNISQLYHLQGFENEKKGYFVLSLVKATQNIIHLLLELRNMIGTVFDPI